MANPAAKSRRRRVVVIGAGFGGLSTAKGLARSPFDVTVVDQHNYHLFQPLLYQVATAGLSPADIASPIRAIFPTTTTRRTAPRTSNSVTHVCRRFCYLSPRPVSP